MITESIKQIKTPIILLLLMTMLTGLIYPTIVTVLAQTLFSWKANGSLLKENNQVIGSILIGQSFTDQKYFWGRPSATMPFPYNAANSKGSNLGPGNPVLADNVKTRIAQINQNNPQSDGLIPVDLVTASGSGLDPDISPLAALYQVPRIALARNLPEQQVEALVNNAIVKSTLGILGEARINVLQLNLALDHLQNPAGSSNGSRTTKP